MTDSTKHEIIADQEVGDFNIWTAYIPEQLRFISGKAYATVVFEGQQTINERFTDSREDAIQNQADAVAEAEAGEMVVQDLDQKLKLTDEQLLASQTYIIEQISERIATALVSGGDDGHHEDCDGNCGGSGLGAALAGLGLSAPEPDDDVEWGQYL